ncbi:histidine ammonia-lyase [Flavisolibacter ginsengisoli]|jgi:histidine ammonia-lyase|uniref:Histidine ammonia-lyase n=1 Tax=Flavisolibacter ginsengisoli DSM 18119 TaxID=1121884 RepID=A0A1M5BU82_9BACT|nr:histidine ammonia-lyase [Flavisolibacter ginsengisoli]SHF46123.1 histidine ammonia-lyase [Flavisolibacter ginsengisoli DSM 18119]
MKQPFFYGKDKLTVQKAISLAEGGLEGKLDPDVIGRIQQSQQHIQHMADTNKTVYGVTTGFGILANTRINDADTATLQYKILQSHSVGVGDPVPLDIAKLMLITKVHALAQGYSGIQLSTLQRILWHIEQNVIPVVPEKGSVGASGDLAPLAHLFLPLIGLGEVFYEGKRYRTQEIFKQFSLQPIQLGPKEGLALINGTQFILAFGIKAVQRMHNCLEAADVIGAMSLEALTGTKAPFDERLHQLRPFEGNTLVAQRLRLLLADSEIMQSHMDCGRVQDPYSLRCMPQVHGASRNAWKHLKDLVEIEANSVTDNPIVFGEDDTISGGNFHGQPLALPLDYACFASAEIGNISDRRCYLLLEGKWGLPMLLMNNVGLNSGFMIPQYTTAALVTENKTLCFPSSADSIPTSLGQEDHVSMGSISGRKLNRVIDNLEFILAIELMSACQAIEFRRPLKSSALLEGAHDFVRQFAGFAEEDRIFADDINSIKNIISDFSFVRKVNELAQSLGIKLNEGFEAYQ